MTTQNNTIKENNLLKTHYTCIHSDKHDYACGECIKKQITLAEQSLVERIRENIFEVFEKHINNSKEPQKGLTPETKLLLVDILSLPSLSINNK